MKAIILAAGVGSRLRPITNFKPKTLVEVNGKPMLGYLLENLIVNGVTNIVICVGYKSEKIKEYCINNFPNAEITFIENKDHLDTNNMYSLYLAREHLNEDVILMNSDLVYESSIIDGLIKTQGTHVAVDKGTFDEESMKVVINDSNYIVDISKVITKEIAFGRSIDVYKIVKEDLQVLKANLVQIIEMEKSLNQWTEVLLQKLFREGLLLAKPYLIGEKKWVEIDNYNDLYYGELLFNANLNAIKEKKLFLLDKDGTLTLGKSLIGGANSFIEHLTKSEKEYCLLSNNSSRVPNDTLKSFEDIGLNGFNERNFIISTDIAIEFFKSRKIHRIYIVANQKVINYFNDNGFVFDDENPQALLLTYDTEIDYSKIARLHNLVRQGIPYYATHIDYVCPTETGNIPDIGSFIKMIEASTGKLPIDIFGKPSKFVIQHIKDRFNMKDEDIVIIGDRLYTDIEQKKYGNIFSILVLTGESQREDVEFSDTKPEVIVKNLEELIKYI